MTPQQKDLVQQTWQQVLPIADTAATLFYERLFEIDPSARSLFSATHMPEQRRKLMQMIGVAVKGLDEPEETLQAVAELGARHLKYGVADHHYDSVGAALLCTLGQGLGESFTPEAKEAWESVYTLLADTMRGAVPAGHKAPHLGWL
jgi:hemoglobin-like flavoprotein